MQRIWSADQKRKPFLARSGLYEADTQNHTSESLPHSPLVLKRNSALFKAISVLKIFSFSCLVVSVSEFIKHITAHIGQRITRFKPTFEYNIAKMKRYLQLTVTVMSQLITN